MKKSIEQINYEIELVINEGLYNRRIITKDIYSKTHEKLLKLIEISKKKSKPFIDTG